MYISSGTVLFVRIKTILRDRCTFHQTVLFVRIKTIFLGTDVHFNRVCTVCKDKKQSSGTLDLYCLLR